MLACGCRPSPMIEVSDGWGKRAGEGEEEEEKAQEDGSGGGLRERSISKNRLVLRLS